MRELGNPFIVSPPTGSSTKTRLKLTTAEQTAFKDIGSFLGKLYRHDLAQRIKMGDVETQDNLRALRKKTLTQSTSSRWAGSITGASQEQYDLALRNLQRHQSSLLVRIQAIETMLVLPVGTHKLNKGKAKKDWVKYGYATTKIWFNKKRRLNVLKDQLSKTQGLLESGQVKVVVGGRKLLKYRQYLDLAYKSGDINIQEYKEQLDRWQESWDFKRMFFKAAGETGKKYGNETIRLELSGLEDEGTLQVKVPAGLKGKYGEFIRVQAPVKFHHLKDTLYDRIDQNLNVCYEIVLDTTSSKWFLVASWGLSKVQKKLFKNVQPTLTYLNSHNTLALDLNADHVSAVVLDPDGNLVGKPYTFHMDLDGKPSSTRDAYLRELVGKIASVALENNCRSVTIENLDFTDVRDIGRERLGTGRKLKHFRKLVASMPTAKFKNRLVSMLYNRNLYVIAVDPAYTSKWAKKYWNGKYTQEVVHVHIGSKSADGNATLGSGTKTFSSHHEAALVIGRRGQFKRAYAKAGKPGNKQSIVSRFEPTCALKTATCKQVPWQEPAGAFSTGLGVLGKSRLFLLKSTVCFNYPNDS